MRFQRTAAGGIVVMWYPHDPAGAAARAGT